MANSRRNLLLSASAAVMSLSLVAGSWHWTVQHYGGIASPPRSQAEERLHQVQYGRRASFSFENAAVPVNQIRSGGVPKDGIPALTDPEVVTPDEARYLRPSDRVIGVAIGNEARAYPLKILNYHEVVNDRLGGQSIVVSYCPLCDSSAVFDRAAGDEVLEFGVSGLLYNSNVLMYDRGGRPESLWSQVGAQGVTGPASRIALEALPMELTTWQDWQARHPNTTVLSDRTGHQRNYQASPYERYFRSRDLMFPVRPRNNRLPPKALVLGIWSGSQARAYPLAAFGPGDETVRQELGDKKFTLVYDGQHKSLRVEDADEDLQWMYSFWFAWYAFRPKTELFQLAAQR